MYINLIDIKYFHNLLNENRWYWIVPYLLANMISKCLEAAVEVVVKQTGSSLISGTMLHIWQLLITS